MFCFHCYGKYALSLSGDFPVALLKRPLDILWFPPNWHVHISGFNWLGLKKKKVHADRNVVDPWPKL